MLILRGWQPLAATRCLRGHIWAWRRPRPTEVSAPANERSDPADVAPGTDAARIPRPGRALVPRAPQKRRRPRAAPWHHQRQSRRTAGADEGCSSSAPSRAPPAGAPCRARRPPGRCSCSRTSTVGADSQGLPDRVAERTGNTPGPGSAGIPWWPRRSARSTTGRATVTRTARHGYQRI